MEEESSEDTQTSEFTHDDCNNIACENFIIMWAKQQGFRIIKDRVVHLDEDEIIDKENVDPLTPILRNPKKRSVKKPTKLQKMWEGWPKLQGTRNLMSEIIN
ncbi:unnamed protein product [Rhizophagus irregularis]|nr:unnamed protein product [Rhizophagus irregularis]CAB4439319.1 unnamed protein product [Rhizophagus irregularis]